MVEGTTCRYHALLTAQRLDQRRRRLRFVVSNAKLFESRNRDSWTIWGKKKECTLRTRGGGGGGTDNIRRITSGITGHYNSIVFVIRLRQTYACPKLYTKQTANGSQKLSTNKLTFTVRRCGLVETPPQKKTRNKKRCQCNAESKLQTGYALCLLTFSTADAVHTSTRQPDGRYYGTRPNPLDKKTGNLLVR